MRCFVLLFLGLHVVHTTITQPACKRLLWFTSLSLPHHTDPKTADYIHYLEVALLSARNAPSLVPVLVYDGPASPLTTWFESMGGLVIFHHLSFYNELRDAEDAGHLEPGHADFVRGTYLRLDIPYLLPTVIQHVGEGIDDANFLYTDTDIMFFHDINSCSFPQPHIALMGPEFDRGRPGNAGVLYVNAEGLRAALPGLLEFARAREWKLAAADQTLLLEGLGDKLELLPDSYNWKGYYGSAPGVQLVHFHGPKPMRCLPCYLRYPDHYKEDCQEDCGGLIHVFEHHVKDRGMYYHKLMQVWMRLHVEALAMHGRVSEADVRRHVRPQRS